jgi:hypothetical protein
MRQLCSIIKALHAALTPATIIRPAVVPVPVQTLRHHR